MTSTSLGNLSLDFSSPHTIAYFNFTPVFQWKQLDYEPSFAPGSTQILEDETFNTESLDPRFMAVYGEMILLSLYKHHISIPASLVSLPTSSASSEPPKLTPFPSREMNKPGICNYIEEAKGLQVDAHGRLWVLDNGSENCNAKIWTIELISKKRTKLIHRFTFHGSIHDLALDETPEGTFAYITGLGQHHIVVFSFERKKTWMVYTPGIGPYSIAMSPKESRELYLSFLNRLYSIPVAELCNGTGTANPKLIGEWSAEPYSMLMDNQGILVATVLEQNYIIFWDTSKPFEEQRIYEDAGLTSARPFTLAKDQNGTLWRFMLKIKGEPKYLLSKFKFRAKSFKVSSELNGGSGREEKVAVDAAQSTKLTIPSVLFVFLLVLASYFLM
ncbi:protein yellow-like isoform X2 [Cloeon dipterum]|uniref:protein yellow-like isoform X2 n=1 Tax=Cloeon dipterum TaxID=197152 RepID=UPI0032206E2F